MTLLQVRVKPNARRSQLAQLEDGSWRAEVQAPPVDGKANKALIALVARHFGVPKRAVTITAGQGARNKRISIED